MKSADNTAILSFLRSNGATRSSELTTHFSISRATLSRRLKSMERDIVVLGKARSTVVAARLKNLPPQPLYQVNPMGELALIGQLIPIANGEWVLQGNSLPAFVQIGEFREGLFPGWPWFLEDLRPSGFLGRAFAERINQLLGFDKNPDNWNDNELISSLNKWGDNLPSNFIIGEHSLQSYQENKLKIADGYYKNNTFEIYPELAERAMLEGSFFGSSAGGEQSKFTTIVANPDSPKHRQVIVKFSPPLDQPAGRRWADLLIAEHSANQILNAHNILAAKTQIFEKQNRVFLESERFDRNDSLGRIGLVSLKSIDAAFEGHGSGPWQDCAKALAEQGLISDSDLETIRCLNAFGNLIANTDMHFANLSFFLEPEPPFSLAPCYDMLPMLFRPATSGEIRTPRFRSHDPRPQDKIAWEKMYPIALQFWQQLQNDCRVSAEFQSIATIAQESISETPILNPNSA